MQATAQKASPAQDSPAHAAPLPEGELPAGDERPQARYTSPGKIIASGLLVIFLFFVVGGCWVVLARIEGAVIANGELKVDSERKTVQHLEGGLIKEICIRDGDTVQAGETLITLDSSQIVSATEQIKLQIMAARLQDSYLEAEKTLGKSVNWPAYDSSIPRDSYDELLLSSRKVFSAGRESLVINENLLEKQIGQIRQQERGLLGRIQAEDKIVKTLQEELDAKQVLYEKQYIDKTEILHLERSIAEHQGSIAALNSTRAELGEKMAELGLRISTLKSDYRQNAITKQDELQKRLFNLQEQLIPLLDAKNRLQITAPVTGEVVALSVHSVGGVISPGQPLLDIVPANSSLIVECNIQVTDITHVFKGQDADIQLLAFNQRTTPKIKGKVIYISADRILQQTPYGEQPSYVVHIELDRKELMDNKLEISPGMPASVFIRTEPRTVLDYMLEPILLNFDRALRETS